MPLDESGDRIQQGGDGTQTARGSCIRTGEKKHEPDGRLLGEVTPLVRSENSYCDMVEKAKHHIREGDIFQIVLSNRLSSSV